MLIPSEEQGRAYVPNFPSVLKNVKMNPYPKNQTLINWNFVVDLNFSLLSICASHHPTLVPRRTINSSKWVGSKVVRQISDES